MLNFFRKLQEVHNPPDIAEPPVTEELPQNYPQLRKQYVDFCQSRSRSEEEIVHDLHELMRMPEISHIGFVENVDSLTCLLGTANVSLINPTTGKVHDIGEFIVQINRREHTILFENITRGIPYFENLVQKGQYHHPHIPYSRQICMPTGKDVLQEYISKGMLFDAARIIIRALWTLDQAPYGAAGIDKWPTRE